MVTRSTKLRVTLASERGRGVIVLLNGAPGCGMGAVARALARRFERAAVIDGPALSCFSPFAPPGEEPLASAAARDRAMHALVALHQADGVGDFVVHHVFASPEALAATRQLLGEIDEVTYAFRLLCSPAELARRLRRRARGRPRGEASRLAAELVRARRLARLQRQGTARGDLGFEIASEGRAPRTVAEAIWRDIHQPVALCPPDPGWADAFARERAAIAEALGPLALSVEHIGSTAVPGLAAKPVIDIIVAVERLEHAVRCIAPLRRLGYAFVDYPQNHDRRFFRKGTPRSHHLHVVAAGGASLRDHLAFRDALRADADLRRRYAALKRELAAAHGDDRARYSAAKRALIRGALGHDPA